eukprot:CAMPEP_0182574892 /NCGR_PEP_ID=MMETSP1324-20130603/27852_1 /TAXON_ID=236786 /ORGANISM="Florenciella sp., Strain RCC1587" /LENGTH=116 /DNA_ID=CAMNT_0024790377 /DNA_START=90 /DNA_END=437 /DNA_ORIENTATION=-
MALGPDTAVPPTRVQLYSTLRTLVPQVGGTVTAAGHKRKISVAAAPSELYQPLSDAASILTRDSTPSPLTPCTHTALVTREVRVLRRPGTYVPIGRGGGGGGASGGGAEDEVEGGG